MIKNLPIPNTSSAPIIPAISATIIVLNQGNLGFYCMKDVGNCRVTDVVVFDLTYVTSK